METRRIIVYGNAGSGKTTMARQLCRRFNVPHLDLETIALQSPGVRKPLPDSVAALDRFIKARNNWVIEGSYGSLIEAALPWCSELYFLNPGMAACIKNSRSRPWEPNKHPTEEDQDRMLAALVDWIKQYETRTDEFSLARHRAIFDGFSGPKQELLFLPEPQP